MFDKRGTGLSDPVAGPPPLEQRMDDMQAVMDAAGVERAALYGISEGGPASVLFAATYPERTSALVLYGSTPRFRTDSDISWGATDEQVEQRARRDRGQMGRRGADRGLRSERGRRSRRSPRSGADSSGPAPAPRWPGR